MHGAILPNVMAACSFAALKESVVSAYPQETQFLLTETVQLYQSPLCWLLNTQWLRLSSGPGVPSSPRSLHRPF